MLCCHALGQGNVQMRLGQFGRALASYRRAADLAPGVRARALGSTVQRECPRLCVCLQQPKQGWPLAVQ